MANFKWRISFLIFPEFLLSDSYTIQHLILCLIIKLIAISTHSFPILSNIEFNIRNLSSLDSTNEMFYPLSLSFYTTLDSLISMFPKDLLQTTTTGKKLWNVLIQSLYSTTWNPAELLSPMSTKHTQMFSQKDIFIIGSFPSLPEEYNVFFSRDVQYYGLQQLSTLFFKQILTPDLTKSLFSNSICLVWLNTNDKLSRQTLSLQKYIKTIFFINKSEILSMHNLLSPYELSQINSIPFNSLGNVSSTYSLLEIFGISSLQSKVYKNDLILRNLSSIVSDKFFRLLIYGASQDIILPLNTIKIVLSLQPSKISFLNYFDFDNVFYVAQHFPCNFFTSNQHYFAMITEKDGTSAFVLLSFLSQFIGYYTFIHKFSFSSLAICRLKMSDSPHISGNISFPCVHLPPFSSQMLFHSFIISVRTYTPDITLSVNHDLLDLIENDHIVNQHSSFTNLYLFSRPSSSKFFVYLNALNSFSGVGVFNAVNYELVDGVPESAFDNDNLLSILIHSVQKTPEFTLKVKAFVSNLNKKYDREDLIRFMNKCLTLPDILVSLSQMKSDNASIDVVIASVEKQIVLRFFLFPLFHKFCSEISSDVFLSESISFLRYLTKFTNPAYVYDFMLKNLVANLDTISNQNQFLEELYLSLGHQLPNSLMQTAPFSGYNSISDDFEVISSPESPLLQVVPTHFAEKIQTFQGLFSENYPEFSFLNRYHSTSIGVQSHERRQFKRNLYDSDLKYCDKNFGNLVDVDINDSPNKRMKVLCEDTPYKNHNSSSILTKIRDQQLRKLNNSTDIYFPPNYPLRERHSKDSPQCEPFIFNTPMKNSSSLSAFHSPLLDFRSCSHKSSCELLNVSIFKGNDSLK